MNWKLIRYIDAWIGIPFVYLVALARWPFRLARKKPLAVCPKNILLVKFWGIGNLFMMLPSVRALRKERDEVSIDLLTLSSNKEAALFTGAFDTVYCVDTGTPLRFLRTTAAGLRRLRRRRYDVVVDFEQFARYSVLMAALVGGRRLVGFKTSRQHRHHPFTNAVEYDNTVHMVHSYGRLTETAGARPIDMTTPLLIRNHMRKVAPVPEGLGITGGNTLIVMHVGTSENFKERRWPAGHYAELADLLAEDHHADIVLTGLADERPVSAAVLRLVRSPERIRDACGALSFSEYVELICSCDLLVSADTAAVHIASAFHVPVVGLYGPNTPALYGAWGMHGLSLSRNFPCSPCITNFNAKLHVCRHPDGKGACMKALRPGEAYEAARRQLPAPIAAP